MNAYKVLIVEDEALIAEDLRRRIESNGHSVLGCAADSEEALALAAAGAPDLVLMDISLRGPVDGIETARRLREFCDAAIVFLTAFSEEKIVARAREVAPEGYLIKPYNPRELFVTLEMAVANRRLAVRSRQGEARLQAAFAASPDPLILMSSAGASLEPEQRVTLERLLGCEGFARLKSLVVDVVLSRKPGRVDCDAGERAYELRAVPVNRSEVLVSLRDMTEARKVQLRTAESMRLLHQLTQKLQQAREEERREVAREIHDELGQCLVGMKMQVSSCLSSLPPGGGDELRRRLEEVSASVDRTVVEVRRITSKLRPLVLDDLGLAAALDWLCKDFEGRTKIACELDYEVDLALDAPRSTAAFRVVQEALTNVAKHARATRVAVAVKAASEGVLLSVRDNGQEGARANAGVGIAGMRERVAAWGGAAELTNLPKKGNLLTVMIPLAAAK